jgi:secreted Zn-dependent insulinase-like peptidase
MKILLNDPIKSLSDVKEYKFFRLQNGLKVMLVKQECDKQNDEELSRYKKYKSNIAAVALCVDSGCYNDPLEVPGMSHLLEHMVNY